MSTDGARVWTAPDAASAQMSSKASAKDSRGEGDDMRSKVSHLGGYARPPYRGSALAGASNVDDSRLSEAAIISITVVTVSCRRFTRMAGRSRRADAIILTDMP